MKLDKEIQQNTNIGFVKGIFNNCDKIESELGAKTVEKFFDNLKQIVNEYYGVKVNESN